MITTRYGERYTCSTYSHVQSRILDTLAGLISGWVSDSETFRSLISQLDLEGKMTCISRRVNLTKGENESYIVHPPQ